MVELYGKYYFINIEGITKMCMLDNANKSDIEDEEEDTTSIALDIFKYEIVKMCVDRVLNQFENEETSIYDENLMHPSLKIAFNTLIKYEILIEENYG